jgi:nicotinamidase-related amidase
MVSPVKSSLGWPLTSALSLQSTALLAIDMQVDFIGKDGWFDQLGIDLAAARSAIIPLQNLMSTCRELGIRVVHTRESYRACGGDIAANIRWRTRRSGIAYGQESKCGKVLTRDNPGWEIIEELQPLPHEWIVDKPGKSSFWGTDLEQGLQNLGIEHLIITGVTTDVCVQTTLRDAADLGFDCILASDAAAASKAENHDAYLELLSSPFSSATPHRPYGGGHRSTPATRLMSALKAIETEPYLWPFDGQWSTDDSAVLLVDYTADLCLSEGFLHAQGFPLPDMAAAIKRAENVLA